MKWAQSCTSVLKCYSFWSDRVDTLKWSRLWRKRLLWQGWWILATYFIMRVLHWGRGLQTERGHGNPPGGHGRGSTAAMVWVFLFISVRCQVMHYLARAHTHIHTHAGCDTTTTLLPIYHLKILFHNIKYDMKVYFTTPSPSLSDRNDFVFSTKGAVTRQHLQGKKKKKAIFRYFPILYLQSWNTLL